MKAVSVCACIYQSNKKTSTASTVVWTKAALGVRLAHFYHKPYRWLHTHVELSTSVLTLSQICLQELHTLHSCTVKCVFSWLNSVCARVCFSHPWCDLVKPESVGFLHYIAFRQWLHLNCRDQVWRGQYGAPYLMSQTHRSETTF